MICADLENVGWNTLNPFPASNSQSIGKLLIYVHILLVQYLFLYATDAKYISLVCLNLVELCMSHSE